MSYGRYDIGINLINREMHTYTSGMILIDPGKDRTRKLIVKMMNALSVSSHALTLRLF